MDRDAIVFVPGVNSKEAGKARQRLVTGFERSLEGVKVRAIGEEVLGGQHAIRLEVNDGGQLHEVDLYEAFWGDLHVHWSQKEGLARIAGGFGLLTFWMFSRVWKVAFRSAYLFIGLACSSVILLLWYYSVLSLGLTAMGSVENGSPEGFQKFCATLGSAMGGWKWWVFASGLLAVLPVQAIVDLAAFAKVYLADEIVDDDVPHRHKLRERVAGVVEAVCAQAGYRRVTVVAHSFGSAIATDTLADLTLARKVRYVTLGSPLRILQARSAWLRAEVRKCLEGASIEKWEDFHSRQDWLCADIPHPPDVRPIESHSVDTMATLFGKLRGDSHLMYYSHAEVLGALVR